MAEPIYLPVSSGPVQKALLEQACKMILMAIGEDPDREGLQETPRRFAGFWKEFTEYDPGKTETTFTAVTVDQMVVVSGLRVWSLCEHHLLPFYCDLTIGYIAEGRILGLSKFGRISQRHAHALQVQERLVTGIAEEISAVLGGNQNVAVLAQGEHLCMTMRGVKMPSVMTSSYLGGAFKDNDRTRAEFMQIALASNNR